MKMKELYANNHIMEKSPWKGEALDPLFSVKGRKLRVWAFSLFLLP
jgi:hypothetical protein